MEEENKKVKFKFLSNLKSKLKINKKLALSLAVVLALVCFALFASSLFSSSNKTETKQASDQTSYEVFVEQRLSNIINSIKGLSGAKVYVSVGQSPEIIYATDQTDSASTLTSSKSGQSIVFSKNGTKSEPVIISTKYPEIKGILIVCKGITPKMNLDLTNCLSLVLNVPISCIQIMEGK